MPRPRITTQPIVSARRAPGSTSGRRRPAGATMTSTAISRAREKARPAPKSARWADGATSSPTKSWAMLKRLNSEPWRGPVSQKANAIARRPARSTSTDRVRPLPPSAAVINRSGYRSRASATVPGSCVAGRGLLQALPGQPGRGPAGGLAILLEAIEAGDDRGLVVLVPAGEALERHLVPGPG